MLQKSRHALLLFLAALAALSTVGCIGWVEGTVAVPESVGTEAVGVTTFSVTDAARDRRLAVEAWYPATKTTLGREVYEVKAAGMAVAKPGYTCGEIADAFFGVLKKYGVEKTSRTGYSVGLSYPPDWGEHTMSIRPGDPSILRANMVFHFMPAIWTPEWGLEITETMRITDESGPECLANVPREMFVKN